jgi:hypothetical protein
MATDIIARGMAANAKKSVTELGDKVESEKWIGTKAEWEAVDKSTIKDGIIVYITDDETVILYDKAEMEKIAAQVATDRKAAETAAQTAQSVADSLPEDYTTAVEKIAENTAEISAVKLTDKELKRRVDALYSIGQGITHQFETDSETAYVKTVPTGGKLMSIKSVGGRSITFNQMYKNFDYVSGGTLNCKPIFKSHKYLLRVDYSVSENTKVYLYFRDAKYTAETNRQITKDVAAGSGKISWITSPLGEHSNGGDFGVFRMVTDSDGSQKLDTSPFSNHEIFDLTTMFDSGNEPVSVEEFEKIFPADYYPYNAGEIVSAGVTEVAVGDTAFPIPEAIKALPGYGWSAGTARNYVDYENKRYVQCVNSVDLGTLEWLYRPEQQRFYAIADSITGKFSESFGIVPNIVVAKYDIVCFNDITTKTDNMKASAVKTANDYITIRNTAYTDATAFKQAMQGVILYYELATPIVTDISSLIPDDFLRNIEVEAKGSVTFKNSNGDDYRIPVPSEEEYIVKLSEVGGTT